MTISAALHSLADRLAKLAPSHRDPHRFHEEKSEIVAELRRLAQSGKDFPIEDRRDAYKQTQILRLLHANDNQPQRSRTATSSGGATTGSRAARRQE